MRSLILTVLYLAKDTIHRWFTRLSSPVARVLVVFFLTLCALCFLGTYVISSKVLHDRIRSQGGDLVHAMVYTNSAESAFHIPTRSELLRQTGAESIALCSLGYARNKNKKSVGLYTYPFSRTAQIYPLLANNGSPTLFYPEDADVSEFIVDVTIGQNNEPYTVPVRRLPKDHLLNKILNRGGIIIPPDIAENLMPSHAGGMSQILLKIENLQSSADLIQVEEYLKTFFKLEGADCHVNSAAALLKQLDLIMSNQMQCRAIFCLGIVLIVGILLTALAGMEYRQNEYIYTLMKSFGIHPLMLVLNFIVENLLLVSFSFAAAILSFMHVQHLVVDQFFKLGQYQLTLQEIMPEIELISASLGLCVLISALPIIVAANRSVGRVLK